jgi:hypothetical protein
MTGPGELSFEWGVSSEENSDDPTNPFDILELFINGESIDFISGEVAVSAFIDNAGQLSLPEGVNTISWIYSKDASLNTGDDKGFVRNVVYISEDPAPDILPLPIPMPNPEPTPQPVTPVTSSSAGGGALYWLFILGGAVIACRKRRSLIQGH